jgi:hypothetical protein
MLVVTNIEYDVVPDDRCGYYSWIPELRYPKPDEFQDAWAQVRETRVVPKIYAFRLPTKALKTDPRVQALKDKGLKTWPVDDATTECSIMIGFLNKEDGNIITLLLEAAENNAEDYYSAMTEANASAAKHMQMYMGVKDQLDREARFSAVHREALWNFKDSLRETSFWKRLTWLFTGVKV